MKFVTDFKDYKLLDTNDGKKLELWGKYKLLRPDPVAIWNKEIDSKLYENIDAVYHRSNKGGGFWEYNNKIPESFVISYHDLKFKIGLMGFKHTGLFPEQAVNWNYYIDKIKKEKRKIKVLNLFAYTGGATVACAYASCDVVHVDSSKGMNEWAKTNLKLSNLENKYVRFIADDVVKFVQREIRRGNKYDAIIMDPPSYGRGSNGEVWDIEKNLYYLLDLCSELLSDDPLFVQINAYTSGLPLTSLKNALYYSISKKFNGVISADEIGIQQLDGKVLPCGVYARWEK